jgi:hypothetical protein
MAILSTTTLWYLFSTHQFHPRLFFTFSVKIPVSLKDICYHKRNYQEALTDLGGSGNYQELTTLFTYSYVWYDLFDMLRSNGFNPL